MEITVFGASGRAGRKIVQIALEKGLNVRAAMRNIHRKDVQVDKRATMVGLDLKNANSIRNAIRNSSVIVNTRLRSYLEESKLKGDWLYLVPPPNFQPEGKQTGHYTLLDANEPFRFEQGYQISYADFALAIVNEILYSEKSKKCLLVTNI